MRQAAYALSFIAIFLALVWVTGCGDVDVLDQESTRYDVSITSTNGEDDTSDIDVVRNICDSGEYEQIGKFGATVTITAGDNTPDLQVTGYTYKIDRPVSGKYPLSDAAVPSTLVWTDVTPPSLPAALTPREHNFTSPKIMADGTLTFEIDIWTQADKQYYTYTFLQIDNGYDTGIYDVNATTGVAIDYGIEAEWSLFQYDYKVIFHCRDAEGNDFDLETRPSDWVNLGDYDNC